MCIICRISYPDTGRMARAHLTSFRYSPVLSHWNRKKEGKETEGERRVRECERERKKERLKDRGRKSERIREKSRARDRGQEIERASGVKAFVRDTQDQLRDHW